AATIGHNFEAGIPDLQARMREAAADPKFEETARPRDEGKRLRATQLAVGDAPTTKRPPPSSPARGEATRAARRGGVSSGRGPPPNPSPDEMGPGPDSAPYRGPRSNMGRPGMRGGFKPKRR